MNKAATSETVLLTGSSGFLGSYILKYLLEDKSAVEIRALDKVLPKEIDRKTIFDEKRVKFYNCDLTNLESCRSAFRGVDVVLHCAALVSYDYPPDVDALHANNVVATENVVKLCIEENVRRLVHCSTTEVTLQAYFKNGIVAISIFKHESKLVTPENDKQLIFGEYAASKLKAEKFVLKSHGRRLSNGKDSLLVVVLRPTLIYGEGDVHLVPKILRIAKRQGDYLPRLSGTGGKQQMTYVANAAWAFIKAKDTLRQTPDAIAGLSVSITDDTIIEDLALFIERVTKSSSNQVRLSAWPVPVVVSYFGAVLLQILLDLGLIAKTEVSPCSIISYVGSIILFNRARASIHMNYWPKFNQQQTLAAASKYYGELVVTEKKCD